MGFVVYHKDSTKYLARLTRACKKESFATDAAAKAALTRACNKDTELVKEDFLITTHAAFRDIEKKELVHNIRFGGMQLESVNTPWSCSVQSETYWSS